MEPPYDADLFLPRTWAVEHLPDGVRLTLPPLDILRALYVNGVFVVFTLIAVGYAVVAVGATLEDKSNDPHGFMMLMSAALATLVIPFGFREMPLTGRFTVSMTRRQLVVECRRWGLVRRWEWAADQVRAVTADGALLVLGGTGLVRILTRRDDVDHVTLARFVQRTLGVTEEARPAPDDVAVRYYARGGTEYGPAILTSARGWLVLQHARAPYLRHEFRPSGLWPFLVWQPRAGLRQWRVVSGDLTCRVREDGSAALRIEPSGQNLLLELRCEDGPALERALGRFWGSREDASPEG